MPDPSNYLFIPYSYSATSGQLAVGASQTVPLLLDQDADFELWQIFALSSSDSAADIRPNNFTVQISDKTNGRLWSDGQTPQAVFARIPGGYELKRPVLLARRSNLSINFVNITTNAATLICSIQLLGAKVLQYNQ